MPHIVVVGGGVAGLAAAWRLTRDSAGARSVGPGGPGRVRVTLVEASPRFGGKIVTEHLKGFLIEGGADSFAARKPRGVGLVRELGLEERLIPTGSNRPGGGRVYVALGGRLVALPVGLSLVVPTRLGPVFRSPLLSLRGKLRVLLDLVLPRRREGGRGGRHGGREGRWAGAHHFGRHGDRPLRSGRSAGSVGEPATEWSAGSGEGGRPLRGGESAALSDESVAAFVRRRFGGEYLARVAGPLLGGIHSTDPEELSIEAAFPHLAALESRHRSLLLGVRQLNGSGPPRATARDTAAARVSLAGGMGELVDALVEGLRAAGVEMLPGCSASRLEPGSGTGWTVHLADGRSIEADAVVLATPPPVAAGLLEGLAGQGGPGALSGLASTLREIPQVSTATVSLGLPRSALGRELRGMGFLVPRSEGGLVSACTFSSLKFPGRAPEGHVLLRAFVGGSGGFRPEALDDDALTERVRAELAEILDLAPGVGPQPARIPGRGRSAEPVVTRVHRFVEANPQYRVGHAERVRVLEAALPPGLVLAGCGYHGLGIPDCIASGERAARAALQAAVT